MKKFLLIFIPVVFILSLTFSSCALEVANVIGPGGGYVFYDRGYYNAPPPVGHRYLECSPRDAGVISDFNFEDISPIIDRMSGFSYGGKTDWVLPTEDELRRMLLSFTWELTRFESNLKYVTWDGKVLYCDFENNPFGDVVTYERTLI